MNQVLKKLLGTSKVGNFLTSCVTTVFCSMKFINSIIFFLGATAPIWALAYLHETLRFSR
jgi:hypothetical protein